MKRIVWSLALLPLLCVTGRAQVVLFTNFGAGFTYNSALFFNVFGAGCGPFGPQVIAAQFRPSVGAPFQDAKLALENRSGTNQLSVYLETDAGGSPGTIIEGPINVTGLVSSPGSVITANSALHPFLVSGTPYWLVAYAADPSACNAWFYNSIGDTSTASNFALNSVPSPTGPWTPAAFQTRTAFQIDGVGPDTGFQTHYSANLNIGESYIDITNTGANGNNAQGPGFGTLTGNICVNVYAFDPNEELIACCSCLVTPDQTVNLGVNANLVSKTLTGVVPTSVTVKLIATAPAGTSATSGGNCTNSAAGTGTPASLTVINGMAAWGTTLHGTPTAGSYGTTETPFTPASPSASELASIAGRCSSIIGNASGFGICSTCRTGALGGSKI